MAKKKTSIPEYGTVVCKGITYFRTRIENAEGKRISLYALTREELFDKEQEFRREVEDTIFRRNNPTVAEYCDKWLTMKSATISDVTLAGYRRTINNHIIKPLGEMYMADVTADDIKIALIPASKKSSSQYANVNMLVKSIFSSAERSHIISYNPTENISPKGGTPPKTKDALSDKQVEILLESIKGLRPYVFIMIGLYAGLRCEEILALQWDCVYLNASTPYISVRRAWRTINNKPIVNNILKTPAAQRDIPIPSCLIQCLREAKENSKSEYVISDSNGNPLNYGQFQRLWKYVKVRSTKDRTYYKYINGESIKYTVTPIPGSHHKNRPDIVYAIDFDVTPHQLRHTYITNLLYAGVDPKTVQYLAGHENSKTTMDIYAKVKYNNPEMLSSVIKKALQPRS